MKHNFSTAKPIMWRIIDALEKLFTCFLWLSRIRGATPWIMLLPSLLLVGLLVLGILQIANVSLHELDTSTFLSSEKYSLANYFYAFGSKSFIKILWRSLIGALIVTLITLFFAFPYAYLVVRTHSSLVRKFLLLALFLPFFIGQVVRAYGWLIVLGSQGFINKTLSLIGIAPLSLLYNYPSVLFGLVQYMLPFAVLMLAPALTAIPEELELAANSLGANWFRSLWHIILPLARPGLLSAGIVVLTLTLTDFAMPAILGGGSQDFIANTIYDQFFRTSNQGLGATFTLLLVFLGSFVIGSVFCVMGFIDVARRYLKK